MRAHLAAILNAVRSAADEISCDRLRATAGLVVATVSLSGCVPAVPLVGADPADPNVPVSGVKYQSGVAPYTRLRPAAPIGWREQNQQVSPTPDAAQSEGTR